MRPTCTNSVAAELARHAAKDLPAPRQVRELADVLQAAGEVPPGRLGTEELLTVVQYLGPMQNIDVRERILNGRKLTSPLRTILAIRLWEVTHPEWMQTFWATRRLARSTATAEIRLSHLKAEQQQIRGRVLDVVHRAAARS